MNKIVINTCYGGFGLSNKAMKMLYELKNPGKTLYFYKRDLDITSSKEEVYTRIDGDPDVEGSFEVDAFICDMGDTFIEENGYRHSEKYEKNFIWDNMLITSRHDPDLIKVVEELGSEASGDFADLAIVEIQSSKYRIDEYDGLESVEEFPGRGWTTIE